LGEHLALSRDLLTALADPMRQDLVQLLARAELNVGEIAERSRSAGRRSPTT
jgi:DNA-binding transcriptional ArsR family regulator